MLSNDEIVSIIKQEEQDAINYVGEDSDLNSLRAMLMDYYNQELYGDEKDGKSKIVTSEVYQVVEGVIPPMMRMFLQNRNIAEFRPHRSETPLEKMIRRRRAQQSPQQMPADDRDSIEQESEQKTQASNYVFMQEHDPENILYHLIKDGLLQITGWTQTYWDDQTETDVFEVSGIDEFELQIAEEDKNSKITEKTENEDGTLDIVIEMKDKSGRIVIDNIPPEEMVISRRARDTKTCALIGQKMLKTRSEINKMGIASKEVVDKLEQDYTETNRVKQARHGLYSETSEELRQNQDRSLDKLWLRRYFMNIDVDQDGEAELYEIFYCDNVLLKKKRVTRHGYSLFCPVPISHKAIGTTPILHMYKFQYWKSTLVRQMNNNIYTTNYPRYFVTSAVNLDDFYSPDSGQGVKVKGSNIAGAAQLIPVDNQVPAILQAIQFVDEMIEKTTGVTSYNQGMDTESLNKTATGFQGIRDMSMMRVEVMARHLANTIEDIYENIVYLLATHQDSEKEVFVLGEKLTIDPTKWSRRSRCVVDVGLGSGERQETLSNLGFLLEQAKSFLEAGYPVADQSSLYKILEKMAAKMGFKSIDSMFNDPTKPEQVLMAQNEQMQGLIQQLEQQLQMAMQQNPMAEAEQIKAQASLIKAKAQAVDSGKERMADMAKQRAEFEHEEHLKEMDLRFKQEQLDTQTALKLTELEATTDAQINRNLIDG